MPTSARPKPPLGAQGEVARRSRDGGDQNRQKPEAYNPSVTLRVTAPFAQGSLPSQALGRAAFGDGASDALVRGRICNPPLQTRSRSSRRGRCPHRPARFCVQGSPPSAYAQSLPLVTKGRWREAPEGIRTDRNRKHTIPQSRFASQLPLHKGACPLRHRG